MFVVFEGIDGSGKTTVSNRVAKKLTKQGLTVTHVRAEGKLASPVAEAIREFGRDCRNLELAPGAELLFYVARDVQMLHGPLGAALGTSDVVIADRYRYTAENLARFGRHLPESATRPILDAALGAATPELVVLVDVDPSLARARRKASKLGAKDKRPPSRKGLAGVGLQYRLRQGYLEMAQGRAHQWVLAPNEGSLKETVRAVTALVLDAKEQGVPAALAAFRARAAAPAPKGAPLRSAGEALERFLAWVDARAELEPEVAAYFVRGLAGAGVDSRRLALAERVPEHLIAGLTGLEDEASWQLRERFRAAWPAPVARSLSGLLVSERARALRTTLAEEAPVEVLGSVARLDDAAAWELRDRFSSRALDAVVGSLAGIDSVRAWTLRERWFSANAETIAADYERGKLAARSVNGLDDERAWAVREKVVGVAPVSVIASLSGLTSPRSFEWRRRYLGAAPKPVMNSLRRVSTPEAFAMRNQVAADCKEALDSIQGMDDGAAWELRETYRDVWPSTVVKTLGELTAKERGQELFLRQLATYPDNPSLLKHASAVALGGYRGDSELDP